MTPVPPSSSSRPHRAARLEDRFIAVVARSLRTRGWVPRIEPYTGYGTTHRVRVLARTLLAPPSTQAGEAVERDPASARRSVRGWRSFVTTQAPGVLVEIRTPGRTPDSPPTVHRVTADRGGYIDASVEVELEPGWREVTLSVAGTTVTAPVLIVGPEQTTAMVSDIDDTVMVTALPRPMLAAWNSMVLDENARRVVPGMAELYARWQRANPGAPTFYLSTGAWNVAPALRRFLSRHGYPAGPLLLTDWGPTNSGWFRSGQQHKLETLRRLMAELPQVHWVLVGDDGQRDPKIYGEIAAEYPDRVALVAIRRLSVTEQLLAHGTPVPASTSTSTSTTVVASPAAPLLVHGDDGHELALRLIDAGLL